MGVEVSVLNLTLFSCRIKDVFVTKVTDFSGEKEV